MGGRFCGKGSRYAAAVDEKRAPYRHAADKNYHKLADAANVTVLDGEAAFRPPLIWR